MGALNNAHFHFPLGQLRECISSEKDSKSSEKGICGASKI